MADSDTSTEFDKNVYWINLGNKVSQLHQYHCNILCSVISSSFGTSHYITNLFRNLSLIPIQGRLDSFVCADYPMNIRFIDISGGRSITSVFYNGANMLEFKPTYNYPIKTPRLKIVFEEDLHFIYTYFNSYISTMNEIINCSYLKTLSRTFNKRFIKLYDELIKHCQKKLELINALRDALPAQHTNMT